MSDDEENYDDFMMSDDDGMIEMEDDEDDEENTTGSGLPKDESGNDISDSAEINRQSLEDLYEIGVYYGEEQDWVQAQTTLKKLLDISRGDVSEDAVHWRHKSLLQILHFWAVRMHYNDLPKLDDVIPACKELIRQFGIQHDDKVWSEIFTTPRGFLFEDKFEPLVVARIELQLECMEPLLMDKTIQLRHNILSIWRDRLLSDSIDESRVKFLESRCFDDNTGQELDALHVEMVSLILQCYIHEFMSSGKVNSRAKFSEFLAKIESHASKSLAVSQTLGIMMQLPLAQSIEQVLQKSPNTKRLQRLFWSSLKQMEEIGGPQKFNSRLEEFILCGFIFSSMIMYRENGEVNPFDLEQVKVGREMEMVQILQDCYSNFVQLNLPQLGISISRLPTGALCLLDVLVNEIYQVAQIAKLWKSLAPLFSCISLQDLQKELQINEVPVTRDHILTILMTSIMKDRAAVYYKLDLKQDLVYFGNENKVPLSLWAKQSLTLDELERSNDIGMWHSTRKLKHKEANAFFQDLQRQRVGEFEGDSFQPRCNQDNLIHELASQAARVWSP
ncbi:COP9 signalosome (CSN) subunit [Zygosaccharomyces mellis]|uniref:COP9 signalosome (CSN) subunit n=1 Tax=Zygosaccharomyces mellis TaxID=42258 RepID=A0A4C2E6N5_9SACH|nr:COP9 signalosome (CSN) subunit [Zygosaccharomyces mellis]